MTIVNINTIIVIISLRENNSGEYYRKERPLTGPSIGSF